MTSKGGVTRAAPALWHALVPLAFLIVLLSGSVMLFGSDSSFGPNQIALMLSAVVAAVMGMRIGFSWKELQEAMVKGVSLAMGAIFILLAVGALIGTWIMAGIVPTMVQYGLQLLSPKVFYVACCAICALIAIATGSSWTTASTVGVALVGVASALGLSLGITAGAIISGAYFGDKLSPLSDTTNLAPAMVGTDLFTHIRHMLWTTVPSIVIALIVFAVLGLVRVPPAGGSADLEAMVLALNQTFMIEWYLLIPLGVVLFVIYKRVPAFAALLIGALLGGVFAVVFQQDAVLAYVGETELPRLAALLKGFWRALFEGFAADTGSAALDDLLTRGGMTSMLNTIWLIISAMMFGASMEKAGFLRVIATRVMSLAKSTGSMIATTIATSISMNIIASDQYIAIVVPGRMFRAEFERRRLHSKNLSRALEDSGTLTSALVPWNTCGAFMAATLGVPTLVYLPYAVFNYVSPLVSTIYGFTGFSIVKVDNVEAVPTVAQAAPA